MNRQLCPHCVASITAENRNGFTQDFHLTQAGRLLLPVTITAYEIEQLLVQVVTTCIDCTHSIYRVITNDGYKGVYVDEWDITTI